MSTTRGVRNGSVPTVLLVHGEFTDGSMWAGVIAELQAAGLGVTAPANPLRGLAADAAYIASVAEGIDGPVVLAGHSYGGAVITAAGPAASNLTGLVYVAGFALDEGESVLDIDGRFPGSPLLAALRPATFRGADGDLSVELYLDREDFPRVFAADLPHRQACAAAAAQRPVAAAAYAEKSGAAAWKAAPSWYLIATADQVITPEAQQYMARRARARATVISASHAVALTQPAAVAGHIAAAATAPWAHQGRRA
jgi:pimeloyl-ACP methyl ester carboxylesterase